MSFNTQFMLENSNRVQKEFIFPIQREQMVYEPTDNRIYASDLINIMEANPEERQNFINRLASELSRKENLRKVIEQDQFDLLYSFAHHSFACNPSEKASILDILSRCMSNLEKV